MEHRHDPDFDPWPHPNCRHALVLSAKSRRGAEELYMASQALIEIYALAGVDMDKLMMAEAQGVVFALDEPYPEYVCR